MNKLFLILVFAITAFAQMNYTPKTEEFQYTESMCWVQMGEIICGGGEMNIYQASDRVIADTIDMTDCIPYDSMKALEHNIEFSDSFKVYSDMRPSGLLNVAIHLDWSCTDPFIMKLNTRNNHDLIYVRLYKEIFKGYDCPENPTEIFYDNEWTAKRVLYECVENPDDYVVHDLDYEEWIRKNGIVYPGAIIRRK
jgi:hypothetical protein